MKIQFKVKRKIYRDTKTNYTIFVAKVLRYEDNETDYTVSSEMNFKGYMHNFKEKDVYTAEAKVELDNLRGLFINIKSVEVERVEYEEEIVNYIKKYTKGIGKEQIEQIVKAFGINTINIIASENGEKEIKKLKIKKLGEKRIKAIRGAIIHNKNYEEVMNFLEVNNFPVSLASKIVDTFGKESIINLKDNPYKLIKFIDFKTLDTIGQRYINNARDVNRISAGIYSYIKRDIENLGNVYTLEIDMRKNITDYLSSVGVYPLYKVDDIVYKNALENALNEFNIKMISENGINYIYRKDMAFMEKRIAERIVELNKNNKICVNKKDIYTKIKEYENEKNIELDELQIEAVISTIQNNLSVLTGGPGTGKTFTTNLIKTIYKAVNKNDKVLLLAPTGKASKRMAEMCKEEAQTIHRGLNLKPLEQVDEEEDKINADFIIIDESSMIDIQMLYNLLVKIDNNTKVLFVGDINQLPSVGAGLVLRDLIDSNCVNVVKLNKVFRQALESNIVYNSHMILKGLNDFKLEKDTHLINATTVKGYYKKILNIINKVKENGYSLDDIIILTPTKKNDFGSKMLNAMLQKELNPSNEIYKISSITFFKLNDKVMQTSNNYDLEVFNGEVGTVKKITTKVNKSGEVIGDLITVDYNGRLVTYNREEASELELAYAMTVHKSQGSEYKVVINLVHPTHKYMLNKNLIYTAWTRAKDKLYILGNEETLKEASKIEGTTNRKSRLVNIIQNLEERPF